MDNGTALPARRRPARVLRRLAALAAGCTALVALHTAPASAATGDLAAPYQGMGTCPVSSSLLTDATNLQVGCVHAEVAGGTFRIGGYSVPIGAPMKLNFGIRWSASGPTVDTSDTTTANVYDTAGPTDGKLVDAPQTEAPIPGLANFWPGVTSAYIQVQPAGSIKNFAPLAAGTSHPLFEMPIKLKVTNPMLGSKCYIGSDSSPIVLKAASPAAPTISYGLDPNGHSTVVLNITGATLSDSSFSVPGANHCGLLTLGESNWILNSIFGLPSSSGSNAVTFTGVNTSIAIDPSISSLTSALNDARG